MVAKFFFYLFLAYVFWIFVLYLAQRQLIYFPSTHSQTPAQAGVSEMQEITLHPTKKFAIKAWYRPPSRADVPTLVYFHGNAGHIGLRAFIVKPLLKKGYGVLLLTYRGYSGNPGKPSEEGLYEDARAAMEFVKNSSCIVLFGESIGAAVAIQMALEYPVKAIILQSPFTSLVAIAKYHYPFIPMPRLLLSDRYISLEKVSRLNLPALVIYAKADDIVPPVFSLKIYEALRGPKELQGLPGNHNDLFVPKEIIQFMEQYVHC